MEVSARNRIPGVVEAVNLGAILAEVAIKTDSGEVTAIITRSSAENLNLKVGDTVFAVVKATEVMVAKEHKS